MVIEEILVFISNLPLKEVLIYLTGKGIVDYSKPGFEKIKQIIIDKHNEGKYAFVPDKTEALFLQQANADPKYMQISMLVPKYKHINLIRTGILLSEYNKKIEKNEEVDRHRNRIYQIKREIIHQPGGRRLLKIAKLPTTEFFPTILAYLAQLKVNGYPEEQLEEEFNGLVDDWQKSSKFAGNDDDWEEIITFCRRQAQDKNPRFFILALYEKPMRIVEGAIAQLESENFFEEEGYEIKISKGGNQGFPKLEVSIFKKLY